MSIDNVMFDFRLHSVYCSMEQLVYTEVQNRKNRKRAIICDVIVMFILACAIITIGSMSTMVTQSNIPINVFVLDSFICAFIVGTISIFILFAFFSTNNSKVHGISFLSDTQLKQLISYVNNSVYNGDASCLLNMPYVDDVFPCIALYRCVHNPGGSIIYNEINNTVTYINMDTYDVIDFSKGTTVSVGIHPSDSVDMHVSMEGNISIYIKGGAGAEVVEISC